MGSAADRNPTPEASELPHQTIAEEDGCAHRRPDGESLRGRYAAALATMLPPGSDTYAQQLAKAVLSVRDDEIERLRSQVARIREQHVPEPPPGEPAGDQVCGHCQIYRAYETVPEPWPCEVIKALDEDDATGDARG